MPYMEIWSFYFSFFLKMLKSYLIKFNGAINTFINCKTNKDVMMTGMTIKKIILVFGQ